MRSIDNDRLCKTSCCSGKPLEPQLPSAFGKPAHGQEKNLGMVKMFDGLGDPHAYFLKTILLVHGRASQTERKLVCNEGLSSRSMLKIQSGP